MTQRRSKQAAASPAAKRKGTRDPMLSFRVPAELRDRIDALAKERGVTRSVLLRELVETALAGDTTEDDDAGDLPAIAGEREVLELLTKQAREGVVSAMNTLWRHHRAIAAEADEPPTPVPASADDDAPDDPFQALDELAPRRRARDA